MEILRFSSCERQSNEDVSRNGVDTVSIAAEPKIPRYTLKGLRRYLETIIAPPMEFNEEFRFRLSTYQTSLLEVSAPHLVYHPVSPVVLDLGAGAGKLSAALLNCFSEQPGSDDCGRAVVIPVEVSSLVLHWIARTFGMLGVVGVGEALPFKSGAFTGVMIAQVMEFIPQVFRQAVALEITRVLYPGGILVLSGMEAWALEAYVLDFNISKEMPMMFSPYPTQRELLLLFNRRSFSLLHHEHIDCVNAGDAYVLILRRL